MKNNIKKIGFFVFMTIIMFFASASYADFLTVDQYLKKVEENNSTFKEINFQIEAVSKKFRETDRAYSASLDSNLNYANDKTRTYSSAISGFADQKTEALDFNVSVNKQFKTGTLFSAGYGTSHTAVNYILPEYTVSDMAPFLALEQSLLKNLNGDLTKISTAKLKAASKALIYLQTYKKQQLILNAQKTYWAFSYAKTVNEFRKMSLERSKKILDWNTARYNKDLAEKNDVLQSKALYKGRELALKQSEYDMSEACRNFNELINISSDCTDYQVESLNNLEQYFKDISELKRNGGKRADVLAALSNAESYKFAAEEQAKSTGADLKLNGRFAFNGANSSFSAAASEMSKLRYPSWALGLSYSVPLDFSLRKTVNEGFEAEIRSAEKQAEATDLAELNDWLQLNTNWKNSLAKYEISKEINKIQQERNIEEQKLLKRGRSTTSDMIKSEDDLDDAVLTQYQMSMDLIFILSESRTLYDTQTITLE